MSACDAIRRCNITLGRLGIVHTGDASISFMIHVHIA